MVFKYEKYIQETLILKNYVIFYNLQIFLSITILSTCLAFVALHLSASYTKIYHSA